jgi:AcrR family transcriptional regulator
MGRRMGDDRREEIIGEAAHLFARNGFHGTSMDDLGTAVGMSGPGLYRHFSGKEAILSAMLIDISERLLSGGRQRVSAHDDPQERLAALVAFHVEFALDNPELIDVQARDLDAMTPDDQRTVRRLQSQYVALWVATIEQIWPEVSAEMGRAAAHAAFGLINSTPYSARLTRPDMARLLQRMATASVTAVAEASS